MPIYFKDGVEVVLEKEREINVYVHNGWVLKKEEQKPVRKTRTKKVNK